MALWGNNDNLRSAGTVSLNYTTKVVTGSGTTFTDSKVGDVIRFGVRGGGGVYYGDAVIDSITSNTVCSVATTETLTGAAIAGKAYYLSELPSYTAGEDNEFSNTKYEGASYGAYKVRPALAVAGVGASVISFNTSGLKLQVNKNHPDAIVNGGASIPIVGIATGTAVATSPSIVGFKTVYTVAPSGVAAGAHIVNDGNNIRITGVAATSITLHSGVTAQINKNAHVEFGSNRIVSLASTISSAIALHEHIDIQRMSGGYDKLVYGIGNGTYEKHKALATGYRTANTGWVGVTTYVDCHGEFRVKQECLVAMSGVTTTGDFGAQGIEYPSPVG
tara:strand:+ start:92 stop:1090 length:999 start_codon:yes stop_codon:yes gene_type:complete